MLLLIVSTTMAQSYVDAALMFSQTKPGGSARVQAIGGSQIALGGDYSSALSNPAGLGMYNRSEFTFSPAVSGYSSTSKYLGSTDKDGKPILNIPGVSFVIHRSKGNNGFLGGSFGLSLSRVNDFQGLTSFGGDNQYNSIIDSYLTRANGYTTSQFDEGESEYNTTTGLAYFNYLIGAKSILDPPGSNKEYFTDAPFGATQQNVIETKGASNQLSISYGGNYKDILFFGGGIGLASINYKSKNIFYEYFDSDTIASLNVRENIQTKGSGVNATIGFIFRPVQFFQIGASFTTPTVYSVSDVYNASINTSWKSFDYYGDGSEILGDESASTDDVVSSYSLTTPFKFSAGVAAISKFGFITGDIEITNPAQTKYRVNDIYAGYNFDSENSEIKSIYKTTLNYRVGAEFRYEIFRVRGGFGVQGNSYKKQLDLNNTIINISGGAGIRTKSFFVDFALINSSYKKYFYEPYYVEDQNGDNVSPLASIKKQVLTAMVTVGFTF